MELKRIVYLVNEAFNVDIMIKSRKRDVVMARAVYYWVAKNTTSHSLTTIGEFVNKDHATVIYSLNSIEDWILYDKFYKRKVNLIKKNVFNRLTLKEFEQKKLNEKYKLLKIARQLLSKRIENLTKV